MFSVTNYLYEKPEMKWIYPEESYDPYQVSVNWWRAFAVNYLTGATSGVLAQILAYPFEFMRTRLAADTRG
jgi:hypothetical protein